MMTRRIEMVIPLTVAINHNRSSKAFRQQSLKINDMTFTRLHRLFGT
jgi:hypothetical protein